MLKALRQGAGSWIVKALLSVLVLSFVGWGIGDVFKGYGSNTLATVAGKAIGPEVFQQAFDSELNRIQTQVGQRISREQASQFGLESQVLSRIVSDAVIDAQARDMKLGISDDVMLDMIRRDPTFQGADGTFNAAAFAEILRANNLSERGFLAKQRGLMLRSQLTESMLADVKPSALAIDASNRFKEETRTIAYVTIPEDKAGTLAEPDEEKLKAFHDSNKRLFSAPEYRKLLVLSLTTDELKKPADITDADLKAAFDARKAQFGSPEQRVIQQLPFKDLAAAEKAYKELKAGKDFVALGKEMGLKDSDIDLGAQTMASMIDAKIAEAAFAVKKNEPTKPVEGTFSVVIARSTEITPATQKTFEQVQVELKDTLAREKAAEELQGLVDKIETARGKNASLREAADKVGVKTVEIAAVDKAGKDAGGQPVAGLPDPARVLAKAFDTDVGVETEAVEVQGGGYVWFDVQGITPETLKPLAEVKDQVKAGWIAAEKRRGLQAVAQTLSERLKKGEALASVAKELGLKVETSKPVKRGEKTEAVSAAAVSLAFSIPRDSAAHADGIDGRSRVVIKIADVTTPAAPDKAVADQLAQELGRQLAGDLAGQYILAIQNRYGVSINEEVLKRATGRTPQQ